MFSKVWHKYGMSIVIKKVKGHTNTLLFAMVQWYTCICTFIFASGLLSSYHIGRDLLWEKFFQVQLLTLHYTLSGMNFCQCSEVHHTFFVHVIFDVNLVQNWWDTYENSIYRWRNFILVMTSGYNYMVKVEIFMLLSFVIVVSMSQKMNGKGFQPYLPW